MSPYQPQAVVQWTCPFCKWQGAPLRVSNVSTGGWIMMVVLLLFCFPLFWIPLIAMKEERTLCPTCRTKVGG